MDLVNILELPSNESSAGLMNNMTGPGRMMTPQNHSNALIQNVTMPAPINNTVNTNSFEPRKSQPHGDRNTTTLLLTLIKLSVFNLTICLTSDEMFSFFGFVKFQRREATLRQRHLARVVPPLWSGTQTTCCLTTTQALSRPAT